jgi:hypothetical protein
MFFYNKCNGDTLFINIKHPDQERILIYEGQYYIKLKIVDWMEGDGMKKLIIVGGAYEINNNEIYFTDPVPMDDTITNKYYTWYPRVSSPKYNIDYGLMIEDIFGFSVNLPTVGEGDFLVTKGKFLEGGVMSIRIRKKINYKIQAR